MRHLEFAAGPADEKKRLDVFLASQQAELSRSRIKKLIEDHHVTINGQPARVSTPLKTGDRIVLVNQDGVRSGTVRIKLAGIGQLAVFWRRPAQEAT